MGRRVPEVYRKVLGAKAPVERAIMSSNGPPPNWKQIVVTSAPPPIKKPILVSDRIEHSKTDDGFLTTVTLGYIVADNSLKE